VLFVASLLQGYGFRVDHEGYGRLAGIIANAVPLALGDELGVALAQTHWLHFGKGEARALEHVHDLLGVGVPVQQVDFAGGSSEEGRMIPRVPAMSLLMMFLTFKPS
jgi:hypothetical protein